MGNGRERGVQSDQRLDTFVHMQLPASAPGVSTTGTWRAAVGNGTYRVTVGVGDPAFQDSHHVVNAEGVTVIDFTPTATERNRSATSTVTVTDGFLDLTPTGGTNTKIAFVDIAAQQQQTPIVSATTPDDGATDVVRDTSVTVQLNQGVDPATANSDGVRLVAPNGNVVNGFYNTDGAYSNITFVPSQLLASDATYRIEVTSSVTTPAGVPYEPYEATFTTGTRTSTVEAPVEFDKSAFDQSGDTSAPTALELGPDGRLYAAFATGLIMAYNLDSTGHVSGEPVKISTFTYNRLIIAMEFSPDSTANDMELWVANNQFGCDLAATGTACDDFTGRISVLRGSSPTTLKRTDVITGLPRSVGDHMTNGLRFGPDGKLYVAQGANNGYGSPDEIWGNRPERRLTAAVLQVDLDAIPSPPLNVQTTAPTSYDPDVPGAPVKLYATGTRNPYSLVWHSNGRLYAPVNESANGNTPADPAGGAPALTDLPAYNDYFTRVDAGKYYGHPNPARDEYRLNGANPTIGNDPFEVKEYPVGTAPNANWRKPDLDLGQHRSADDSVEYLSDVFGGKLMHDVLVTEFAGGKDIIALNLDQNGIATSKSVVAAGFNNPLPITSDPETGRIYVGEFGAVPTGEGGKITLLSPHVTQPQAALARINFQSETAATPTGYNADYGLGFSTASGFGWEDAQGSPTSRVGEGRDRDVMSDQRRDTFVHMARNGTPAGRWEIAVPNGTYSLTIGVGDPSFSDSHHVIRAEGTVAVDFTPTSTNRTQVVTTTVPVDDGRLTLDQVGGTNTKIAYLEVSGDDAPPPSDTTPPTVDVALSGDQGSGGAYQGSATATISAADGGGSGVASVSYTLDGGAQQTYSQPVVVSAPGEHTLVATATDSAGNVSQPTTVSFTVATATAPTDLHVNFGTQDTTPPQGNQADYGQAFDATRGYGWETTAGAPLSKTGEGRERGVLSDVRRDSLMHLARRGTQEARWEHTLPNGTYQVTVGVGDPSYFDSRHVVRAEGGVVIDFTPTDATRTSSATATVTVNDGRLTLDQQGGTNTKIEYLDVAPVSSPPAGGDTTAPEVTVAPGGTENAAGEFVDSATVTISADDGGGSGVDTISYTIDGGPDTPYSGPFTVTEVGEHTVRATATDNAGNTSAVASSTFTVATQPGGVAKLEVTSPDDALGLGSRLVFSTNAGQARPGRNLTVSNAGTGPLALSNIRITGSDSSDFALCSGQPRSVSVPAGGDATVCARYTPSGVGVDEATLSLDTDAPDVATYEVTLGGLNAAGYEGANEPTLAEVIEALGYSNTVPVDGKPDPLTVSPSSEAVGNEVISAYWKKLDATKPVRSLPVARYVGNYATSQDYGLAAKGGSLSSGFAFSSGGDNNGYGENQKLLPVPSPVSAEPYDFSGSFGYADGYGNRSEDALNTGRFHNVRFFPALRPNGTAIAGAYLVAVDTLDATNQYKNWDYQDVAFLLTNAQPDGGDDQIEGGSLAKRLTFAGTEGGLAGSGFAGANGTLAQSDVSVADDELRITSAQGAVADRVNSLYTPVHAGTDFQVAGALSGPLSGITGSGAFQAIFFGIAPGAYLRVGVEPGTSTPPRLGVQLVQNGSATMVATADLPNTTVNSLHLRIDVTPAAVGGPSAAVSYSVNGSGTFDAVGSAVTLPSSWVLADARAGVMQSSGSGASFTAAYDSFAVIRRY